ncbi:hypothetical protein DPX16_14428 [Anabarilius grahami]|uniref:Uncharacterized protein n=1 Tax=Anabarilius grahami TaxID=495550 RepID=A0A3N0XQE1_ANAGA|nr:hypothetical protein DPX16_14428 [Anabarilius grahami]
MIPFTRPDPTPKPYPHSDVGKSGIMGGDDIVQKPKILWKPKGNSANMSCTHTKGLSYFQMYWYRQRPGETMRLIVITTAQGWNQSAERDDMSNAPHLSVSFFVLCLAVTILGKSVVQTPPDLLKKEKEFAEIECSHKVQSYNVIQWYKQSQSIMDLQLMGFLNIGSTPTRDGYWFGRLPIFISSHDEMLPAANPVRAPGFKRAAGRTRSIMGGDDVVQKPKIVWKPKGNSANMSCTHTKGLSYYQMYWYRQRPGETMRLIVFTSAGSDPDFGDVDKDKFEPHKSVAESGSLMVKI